MRSFHFTIAKNALANIVRGGASAIVAIILPHFLTRLLGHDRFAGWALMLQVAAYANYLDFGLQTAVARYLAAAMERNDCAMRDRLLTNAIALLSGAGTIVIVGLSIVAWQLPVLFRSVPAGLSGEIGWGIVILGLSAALGLPLSAFTGALIGLQRNELPAAAYGLSRIFGAVLAVLVAHRTQSLLCLALCIAGFNLLGGLAQFAIAKRLLHNFHLEWAALDRGTTMELVRYCSTLSIWSFAMLLVSGLDVTIVGLFNFQAVGAYSLAATLIMFFTGFIGAAFSAMLAPVAILQARQEYDRIRNLMLVTTRLSSYFSVTSVVAVFLFGELTVRTWVGASYLGITLPVLKILFLAQAVRLTGNACGTVLVGMGLQRYGLAPAILEGLCNLVLSVAGMYLIGPPGVAWATLIAAAIALSVVVFYVMPRLEEVGVDSGTFLWQGLGAPILSFLPVIAWIAGRKWLGKIASGTSHIALFAEASAILATIALVGRGVSKVRSLKV